LSNSFVTSSRRVAFNFSAFLLLRAAEVKRSSEEAADDAARHVEADVFREHRIHRVTLPVAAGPHINTASEAWERNEIFRQRSARVSRLPLESAMYIDAPRRAPLDAANIGDGLIFCSALTRGKIASDSRTRGFAASRSPRKEKRG